MTEADVTRSTESAQPRPAAGTSRGRAKARRAGQPDGLQVDQDMFIRGGFRATGSGGGGAV